MKKILTLILCIFSFNLFAVDLRVGDLLLQPLHCWSCTLIEEQEETIYSHMGIVIATKPAILVAEALTTVRVLPLNEFNARTQKGQKLSVRRLVNSRAQNALRRNEKVFQELFATEYEGLKYDHNFLWNNFDENGNEKMYCSEFVTKLLSHLLRIEFPMKRMKFDKNRQLWIRYFKGNPPDGEWGNSPGDFERSHLFYEVGEL